MVGQKLISDFFLDGILTILFFIFLVTAYVVECHELVPVRLCLFPYVTLGLNIYAWE